MIVEILILLLLIFINGIFSASEMAFLNISKYDLNTELKKKNKKAKKIVELINDESALLSTIQIAITFSGFFDHVETDHSEKHKCDPVVAAYNNTFKLASKKITDQRHQALESAKIHTTC